MSPQEIGFLGIAGLLVLLTLGCPVGIAMILVGFTGFAAIIGLGPALNVLQTGPSRPRRTIPSPWCRCSC